MRVLVIKQNILVIVRPFHLLISIRTMLSNCGAIVQWNLNKMLLFHQDTLFSKKCCLIAAIVALQPCRIAEFEQITILCDLRFTPLYKSLWKIVCKLVHIYTLLIPVVELKCVVSNLDFPLFLIYFLDALFRVTLGFQGKAIPLWL